VGRLGREPESVPNRGRWGHVPRNRAEERQGSAFHPSPVLIRSRGYGGARILKKSGFRCDNPSFVCSADGGERLAGQSDSQLDKEMPPLALGLVIRNAEFVRRPAKGDPVYQQPPEALRSRAEAVQFLFHARMDVDHIGRVRGPRRLIGGRGAGADRPFPAALAAEVVDEPGGYNPVQETAEPAAASTGRIVRPILADRFKGPEDRFLLGVQAVGVLEAQADGEATDQPAGGVAEPPEEFVDGRGPGR
jgi:hypothetical protein